MKIVFLVVLVLFVFLFLVNAEEWSKSSTCTSLSESSDLSDTNCTVTARWRVSNGDECTESEYYKNTITSSSGLNVGTDNGVAQCTKTPCDATEKTTVDCETAFGSRLNEIQ